MQFWWGASNSGQPQTLKFDAGPSRVRHITPDYHKDTFQSINQGATGHRYILHDRWVGFLLRKRLNLELSKPYKPFDTGWHYMKLLLSVNLFPFMMFGILCMHMLTMLGILLLCLFIHAMWQHLLQFGCCFVVLSDLVVVFEQWLFSRVNIYAYFFSLMEFVIALFPNVSSGGNLPQYWDNPISHKGIDPP